MNVLVVVFIVLKLADRGSNTLKGDTTAVVLRGSCMGQQYVCHQESVRYNPD
jgi:hypothetical protein